MTFSFSTGRKTRPLISSTVVLRYLNKEIRNGGLQRQNVLVACGGVYSCSFRGVLCQIGKPTAMTSCWDLSVPQTSKLWWTAKHWYNSWSVWRRIFISEITGKSSLKTPAIIPVYTFGSSPTFNYFDFVSHTAHAALQLQGRRQFAVHQDFFINTFLPIYLLF